MDIFRYIIQDWKQEHPVRCKNIMALAKKLNVER